MSRALERVQGAERTEVENYRVEARMAALEEAERLRKARYEAIQRRVRGRAARSRRARRSRSPRPSRPRLKRPKNLPAPAEAVADPFATPDEKSAPATSRERRSPPGRKAAATEAGEGEPAKGVEKKATVAAPAAPAGEDPFASEPP